MTPLAQEIVRQRSLQASPHLQRLTRSDCRCFEVSAVLPLMQQLALGDDWDTRKERLAFLPAPVTWIEWHDRDAERKIKQARVGFMLTAYDTGDEVTVGRPDDSAYDRYRIKIRAEQPGFLVQPVWRDGDGLTSGPGFRVQATEAGGVLFLLPPGMDQESQTIVAVQGRLAAAALALINTPRLVGRKTHLPHAGLQRELARKRRMVGKFPLQAWTEITLDLTPPKEALDDGHEAHLSGGKALHFCRAYLRLRNGQVEFVRHHWRGDPSLGLRRSRYTLAPPRPRPRHGAAASPP